MSHVRTQLRERLVAVLGGLPTTGARVAAGRLYPLPGTALPALTVRTPAESAEGADGLARDILERRIDVEIIGHAAGGGDLEAVLDQIALEVEAALGASLAVSGRVVDLAYLGAELELDGGIDAPAARLTLRYAAQIWTPADDPGAFATL
jgi:hypothetical protein